MEEPKEPKVEVIKAPKKPAVVVKEEKMMVNKKGDDVPIVEVTKEKGKAPVATVKPVT